MTWDMSCPPSPKQRAITGETMRRQQCVAYNARRTADDIVTGRPLPPLVTSRPARRAEPREVPVAEHAELLDFAATEEGRAINHHLRQVDPITQLRLLRAYRRCSRNETDAWDKWLRLLLELGLV
jgi:hypothetical protein